MGALLYYVLLALVKILQALPMTVVATVGRAGGGLAYYLDARHRRVTVENLRRCFAAEKTPAEIRALAREHFRRLGENYAGAVKAAGMTDEALRPHLELIGAEKFQGRHAVIAIGHFGNFEAYARLGSYATHTQLATTYRALPQPRLNALLLHLRTQSNCLFFDRRSEAQTLARKMSEGGISLGLLCDQNVGRHGVRVPFFGFDCATSAAPALLAQRYGLPLLSAVCFRAGPGRWRVELSDEVPTMKDGVRRPAEEIMTEVNALLEAAVRRDPPNWFWVHDRWRFGKKLRSKAKSGEQAAAPAAE